MAWNSLASNQTVSFSNLDNAVSLGYFVQKAAIADSNEQITKADADAKVYLDTAYGPFAAKSSNQLVVKSNLRPVSYAYTIYYEEACYYDGFYIEGGASSSDIACSNTLTITLYSPVSSFANGMKLFYDSACSNPWYGDTGGCGQYYKVILAGTNHTFTYPNSGSTVQNLTACSLPCECFVLYNDDSIDISISFYECGGSTINPECLTCAAASQIYICVQGGRGGEYTVSYGTNCAGGPVPAFTLTALGTNCTTGGDCI
jgi:hypothetical protein